MSEQATVANASGMADRSRFRPSSNGAAVFWLLIVLGVGTFSPCIVLPEWRGYQAAKIAEQRERHRIDQLKAVVSRERRQLDAIHNDPTVVARLAQRDLGFHRPGEKVVNVPVPDADRFADFADVDGVAFVPQPVDPPAWFSRATQWLPDLNYDAVFCDPSTRPIVMLMSVSLIAMAAVLFRQQANP